MPTVAWIAGYGIVIYYEDHDPPHFHVKGKGLEAKFLLEDLSVVEAKGTLKPGEIKAIKSWARPRLPELYACWRAIQAGDPLPKIKE